ncbi:MAG: membrane protein insertion efficiency factor YidD [Candidatus Sungbacteria bacterium]|nr:membrane protein insertion efficiency factor YidD [Candidatus Sungbacteria bacterium]
MTTIVLTLIRIWQRTFSSDHSDWFISFGGRCRFFPSCSEYAHQAVSQYGLIQGSMLSLYRVIRCTPFSRGGYDPVEGKYRIMNHE